PLHISCSIIAVCKLINTKNFIISLLIPIFIHGIYDFGLIIIYKYVFLSIHSIHLAIFFWCSFIVIITFFIASLYFHQVMINREKSIPSYKISIEKSSINTLQVV